MTLEVNKTYACPWKKAKPEWSVGTGRFLSKQVLCFTTKMHSGFLPIPASLP